MRLDDWTTRCRRIGHRRNPTSTVNVRAGGELFTFYVIRRMATTSTGRDAATTVRGEATATRCSGGGVVTEAATDAKLKKRSQVK